MKTRHYDVYYYLQDQHTVKMACLMAERWYARLSRMFNHELKGRQPLDPLRQQPRVPADDGHPGDPRRGHGRLHGVVQAPHRPALRRVARRDRPRHRPRARPRLPVRHHGPGPFRPGPRQRRRPAHPAVVHRGHGRIPVHRARSTRTPRCGCATPSGARSCPPLKKLDNSYKFFPYRWGQAVWAYITGRWGDEVIGKMMKSVGRAGDYEIILESVLGIKLKQLSADWHKAMQDAYGPVLEKTQPVDKFAKTLFKGVESNPYNIAPSISPDGKSLVFLSTRGPVLDRPLPGRRRTRARSSARSSQPPSTPTSRASSSSNRPGPWDADGERFVFGGVAKGRPGPDRSSTCVKDKIVREIPFRELAEILSPAFSPDGRYLVFTGLAGGVSDLFIYDLRDNILKQMTRDVYADLQPAWSPDGKTIAFVTERFSANLEWIDPGHYELALMDVESGRIQKLLAFPNGKNINPQWTADSQSLYFMSDQSGKTDIYRIEVGTAKITQVTNLYTGVAGITELSPSLSVAQGTGRLVFSGYLDGYYSIYSIDDAATLSGQTFLAQFERDPAILAPRKEPEGSLLGLLKNPLFGLPKDQNFTVSDYKPRLGLDYVSPPNIAVGVDRYGTYGAGGLSAYWSDMLGYQTIVTTAFTGSRLIDTSGVLAYLNNRRRFNWGAAAQRIVYPYPYYSYYQDGDLIYEIEDIYRLINYDLSVFGQYPLSQVSRFQLSAGYRITDYNHTIYQRIYDLGGFLLDYQKYNPGDMPEAMNYAYLTGAYYYDTGMFGATSPILGQNLGIAVSPSVGKITFTSLSIDFRKYIMPVRPFTLAFRAMHFGRYGKDSEDTRFYPLYLRLLGPRPRLRILQQRGAGRLRRRPQHGLRFRPSLRQPDVDGQRRAPLPPARHPGARQGLLRRLAPRVLRLL
ncbi:MAG: hypothetical protein M0C28_39265 [Candidatus Moduliflexus flocculans]|nr:hypothetical protein [Candidatus Moduliflexus flocculans]